MSIDKGRQDFFTIRYGTVAVSSISPESWIQVIRFLLNQFKPILEKAFSKGRASASIFGTLNNLFFNYPAAGTCIKRKAEDKVIDSKTGTTKESQCIKVKLLERKKRKGICFERWLMIRPDIAKLFIVKLWYKTAFGGNTKLEIVTKSELVPDLSIKEDREVFEGEIIPFLSAGFFKELMQVHLLPVFEYWKKMEEDYQNIKSIMQDPLDILNRLEIVV